jgi:hypothetical protein
MWKGNLLSAGSNAKTVKGDGSEYVTAIMYLTPWKSVVQAASGEPKVLNVCPMAEEAKCIDGCLNSAGRGAFNSVQAGRARKTQWFATDREGFMLQLYKDILSFSNWCNKQGVQPCVRLNGTSDIRWELIKVEGFANIFEAFPSVQFYDYTKIANRKVGVSNYHLTWSYSNASAKYAAGFTRAIANGLNVAVVFRHKDSVPSAFNGVTVIDGDKDDLRFLDPKGVVVGLYAKGKARKDTSGFVI